jgi:O-antigen/teichoic acid export membrane protein
VSGEALEMEAKAAVGGSKSPSFGWVTWSSLGIGVQGVGQLALLGVLARHLDAGAFGVMTATLIIVGVGRAIHDGVAPALVQRVDLTPDHVRSAFALSWLIAVALIAMVWLTAPIFAWFFHMDDIVPVMRATAILFAFQAPGLVPAALLQREMKFQALARAEILGVLVGWLPVGIGCAWLDLGIWSLVAAYLAQAVVKSGCLVIMRPHEIALWPVPGATWDLVYFGGGFVAGRLCNVAATECDNLAVGRWMSAAALGIYGRAYQLMKMPAMFLGEVVDRIVFPLLARVQDDRASLQLAYSRGMSLVATVMLPASAVGIVLAPDIVSLLLGPNWDSVVLPFQILMMGLIFRTGYKIADVLARATGMVYHRAWREGLFAVLIFVGAIAGTRWGAAGVAVGVVLALGINYLSMAHLSLATTGLSWSRFAALHFRGLVLGALLGGAAWLSADALRAIAAGPAVVLLATLLGSGAVLGAALVVAPRHTLGGEGVWLLSALVGRAARPRLAAAMVGTAARVLGR